MQVFSKKKSHVLGSLVFGTVFVGAAKDAIDALTTDPEAGVDENLDTPTKAGEAILKKAKEDLEAQRKSEETPSDIENTEYRIQNTDKILRNGTLYILVGDKMYDAAGRLVK